MKHSTTLIGEELPQVTDVPPPPLDDRPMGFQPSSDDEDYLTVAAAERRLRLPESQILCLIREDSMIGLPQRRGTYRIPVAQFATETALVDGVPDVLRLFRGEGASRRCADHASAWAFLQTSLFAGDSDPRPIDKLRSAMVGDDGGRTKDVLAMLELAKQSVDHGDHF